MVQNQKELEKKSKVTLKFLKENDVFMVNRVDVCQELKYVEYKVFQYKTKSYVGSG